MGFDHFFMQDIPKPLALPPFSFCLEHIIAIADAPSQISYQVANVAGPSMLMVNSLFSSPVEKQEDYISPDLGRGHQLCFLTCYQRKWQSLLNIRFSRGSEHPKLLARSHGGE